MQFLFVHFATEKRRFLTHFEKNMQKSDFFLHFLYYYSNIEKIIKKNL